MNEELKSKIMSVYKECKAFLTSHEFVDVYLITKHTSEDIWAEFARQINYTNMLLAKQKDLYFLLTLLSEAKSGISSGTPSGNKALKVIDGYSKQIELLLKSYNSVIIGQRWILDYYNNSRGLY